MLGRWLTGARVERVWVPLDQMAPALRRAVIAAEDGQFCRHWGVDLREIREAIQEADDLSEARGGSTISQQTAKNLFLWPGRSFVRKILEAPLAVWIDLVLASAGSWRSTSTSPNGDRTANSAPRRAPGGRSAARSASSARRRPR